MRNFLKTIPNQLTAARLVLIPVMWVLAWLQLPAYIGVGTFISFITDVLDGHIARKLNQVSEFGSQFDSIADHLLLPSALAWLWLFRPEIYRDNLPLCLTAIILYIIAMLVGIIKFRRFANLHLYSSKASAVAMYLFISYALIVTPYNRGFFYLTSLSFIVACLERIVLQVMCSEVDEHMGSLLLVWQHRRQNTDRQP